MASGAGFPGWPGGPGTGVGGWTHGEELRLAAKLTLHDLAERCGLSQPFLSQLENGKSLPSLLTLHRIAGALGTTAHELLVPSDRDAVSLVRFAESSKFQLGEGSSVRFLVSGPHRKLEANEVTARPGAAQDQHLQHPGEEFVYLLEGAVEVTVGQTTNC